MQAKKRVNKRKNNLLVNNTELASSAVKTNAKGFIIMAVNGMSCDDL